MHAEDVIAGARVYGLLPEDRPAVCKLSLSSLAARSTWQFLTAPSYPPDHGFAQGT